jgi:hypothetical protein
LSDRLDRNDRDDSHIVWIDDDDLVFVNEIKEAAPFRLDLHQSLGHRHDFDAVPRNHRSHGDIEIKVTRPRRAVDDGAPNLAALLFVELYAGAAVPPSRSVAVLRSCSVAVPRSRSVARFFSLIGSRS